MNENDLPLPPMGMVDEDKAHELSYRSPQQLSNGAARRSTSHPFRWWT
jgi:hypothetical protein